MFIWGLRLLVERFFIIVFKVDFIGFFLGDKGCKIENVKNMWVLGKILEEWGKKLISKISSRCV